MDEKENNIIAAEIERVISSYESEQDLMVAIIGHYNSGEKVPIMTLIKLLMRIQDYMSKFEVLSKIVKNEKLHKRLKMMDDYSTIFEILEESIKKSADRPKYSTQKNR